MQSYQGLEPRVLAGRSTPDDAVVVRLPGGTLLVQTLDFFTPICDDPYLFGLIAAANSLSDVYAMGGTPFTAMNICCFPVETAGLECLGQVLRGGAEQVQRAGAILAGGHTVVDDEPKFGLAVTGLVEECHLTTKERAQPGDLLVLSKPLGTGVLTTAVKKGRLQERDIGSALEGMSRLNAEAAALMRQAGVKAATDITGYGLLGHAWEMVREQPLRFVLEASRWPLYEGAWEGAREDLFPGGSRANRRWLDRHQAVRWHPDVDPAWQGLATDAQTSGGLLMAWPSDQPVPPELWIVGRVEARPDPQDPPLWVLP